MTRSEIKKAIKLKGLKKSYIASKLEVNPMTISHALKGKRKTKRYKDLLIKIEGLLK